MEVCAPCNQSASLDIDSSTGSSIDPHNQIQYSSADHCASDLERQLTEILSVEDILISTRTLNLSPRKNGAGNGVKENEHSDCDKSTLNKLPASGKCLNKCATFPPFSVKKSSDDAGKVEKHHEDITAEASEANVSTEPLDQCFSRSMSLPVSTKLVSAMKGSRQKQGIPPKKLSVTWAPDVYDPIPTSVSHFPSNKNQRNYSNRKRPGKYKQKGRGKSSQGSKAKDKKHSQKSSRGPNKLNPFHEDNSLDGFEKPQIRSVDFDAGNPEPFCGSSFIKTSVSKLHFPVAEATR